MNVKQAEILPTYITFGVYTFMIFSIMLRTGSKVGNLNY